MTRDRTAVLISGNLALFTRPELKVERVSYEVITPSAARGVLDAICWKPEMRWVIERITVLNPPRFMSVLRNEVASKVSGKLAKSWASRDRAGNDYHADEDRVQRHSLLLRDVAYVVHARCELTSKAGPGDSTTKYIQMFERRIRNGQHFQQPCLGCREFPATVKLANGREAPGPDILAREVVDLGFMLHDLDYGDDSVAARTPRFFHAIMRAGVIDVPPFAASTSGASA